MTVMNCAEAEELLGAYALDAVTEEEARRFEQHLRGCEEHRSAAADLRNTGSLLALTADEREPSPELRRRILQAVSGPPSQLPAQSEPAPTSAPPAMPSWRARALPRWTPRPARFAIAAAMLLALGVSAVIGYQIGLASQPAVYTFKGDPTTAPGAEARLVYFKDSKQAILVANGLPRLTAGQLYEMWLIRDGVPADKGVSTGSNGELAAQLSADITQFQQIAITIEPGEQPLPTTKPILIGQLHTG